MTYSANTPIEGFRLSPENSSSSHNCATPVLLMTFNRPEETQRSFAQIKRARPKKLYISGDGPRPGNTSDTAKVRATRDFVSNNIDWECEVKTLFREENLGCREGVASAIDWFFSQEEEGIIIEDDIVVSDSFFTFAAELLNYYRHDTRIMCITGVNHQDDIQRGKYSYYFSQLNHVWGWASWRRAWKEYRIVEKKIPELITEINNKQCPGFTHNKIANFMWQHNLINAYNSVVDTWDYIWTFAVLINSGLTCTPNVNLIEHIGYGENSTHIKQPLDFTVLQRHEISFPLQHPDYMIYDKDADDYTYKKVFFLDRFAEAYKQQQQQTKVAATPAPKDSTPQIFQNNGNMKVLFISTKDSGGAGGAARRLHEALLKAGIDSVMLVLDKATTADRVAEVEIPIPGLDRSKPSAQLFYAFNLIQQPLNDYPKRSNPEMFTTTASIIDYHNLLPFIQQADIIHLHWIDGFFDYTNAPEIFADKKIIWTLHDMYQFTGGCHYSFNCNNYTGSCASCPQLVQENAPSALTRETFQIKQNTYRKLDIHLITPSIWLADCTRKSNLLREVPVEVIPNTFNTEHFRPIDKITARNRLNLPKDKKIILFGADSIFSPIKNIKILLQVLSEMCNKNLIDKDEFQLVLFGRGQFDTTQFPFSIIQFGLVESPENMPYIYSSADFLVLPSIMDNFPNIMCEALACGTPVVGFRVGGLPDLITTNQTGYLAEPYNLEELQQGILWGLTTAYNNQQIQDNCRKLVETELNEKLIITKTITLYHKALNKDYTLPKVKEAEKNSNSNDPLRKRYLNTIHNTLDDNLADIASSFTDEITNWLLSSILPHRNLTPAEIKLKNECLDTLHSAKATDSEYLRALLYAVVLVPSEELPLVLNIFNQPEKTVNLLTQYIFTFKELPTHEEFSQNVHRHMLTYLQMLKKDIQQNPNTAQTRLMNALNTLRKIPIYCAPGGLKQIMKLSADMMRQFLVLNNYHVDYHFPKRDTTHKIRLGILLQALGEHSETYATLSDFIHLNRDEYEIFIFVLKITGSRIEMEYKNFYDHLIEISPTQIQLSVNQIRNANLDIMLIGTNITALANHNALISTHRLARVQAVQFCNPCTTGIKNIDYFITSHSFSLKQEDFTERLIFNQHSSICFEGNNFSAPTSPDISREKLGIPQDCTAFVTGANFYKFTWELKEFWIELLRQNPNSYLIIFPFGPAWTDKYPVHEFNNIFKNQFKANGVDPDRLIILKPMPTRKNVRQAVSLCDIYLDSFPYSGATSLLDPLHTALPIICLKTASIRGGQGSAMLEDIGLTELITTTKEEYLQLAKKLADDHEYRLYISDLIREKMATNPLFLDAKSFSQDIDTLYKTMLTEYEANNTPAAAENITAAKKEPNKLKPNDLCSCGSGLKYKKCCGKKQ